ncbi:hypothetical protein [Rhodocyclus tenuis]|uniref:Uncharacterized protein n=1 Tax=Rhodocyclus tenuis TaxID=1066 RepID=A0A840G998_RHOTE|nr:hypothetical protein [Rhodocyclus tenuis]MBB4247258.1 hypothetical protein [Rhodocyclus tenuis]
MPDYEVTVSSLFQVNVAKSIRDRLGQWLRDVATRIDGRHSLEISIVTAPPISHEDEVAIIHHGLKAMSWAVTDSAQNAATESILQIVSKAGD